MYYILDFENKKTINYLDLNDLSEREVASIEVGKWNPIRMTVLNGKVYCYYVEDGKPDCGILINDKKEKLTESKGLYDLKRTDNFVIFTFDTGDNLVVFDKDQKLVGSAKGYIIMEHVNEKEGEVYYIDEDTGETKKLIIQK